MASFRLALTSTCIISTRLLSSRSVSRVYYRSVVKTSNRFDVQYSRYSSSVASLSRRSSLSTSLQHSWTTSDVDKEVKYDIKDSLKIRNLSDSILKLYDVRIGSLKSDGERVLVFPWSQGVRTVRVVNAPHTISNEVEDDHQGVFGWTTVNNTCSTKHLIITDNELDAMAAHQGTNYSSIAIRTSHESSVPLSPQIIKHLEQVDKIYIWCQNDTTTTTLTTKLSKLLRNGSCFTISSKDTASCNGALDALNKNFSFDTILSNAQSVSHKKILNFSQLKDDVYLEFFNSEKVAGVKWNRFSHLTKLLKGFRPGELTIFTGATGCGKTTLMSELSLDLCQQGVSTLWGSFEISNVRLIKTMLRQLSGVNLDIHLSKYQSWADKFQSLPFQFMGFHGQADLTHVLNAMHHSVKFNGVQHIIIDNLQFMVGIKSRGFDDSFHAQNAAIAEFRNFATTQSVHITIIVHPRKEGDDKLLSTASIFGTAKAGQEADNVLILQAQSNRDKFLQVTKNRFSGDLGCIPLKFDRNSLTFSGVFQTMSIQNEVKVKKTTAKTANVPPLKPVTFNSPNVNSPSFLKPLIPTNSHTTPV